MVLTKIALVCTVTCELTSARLWPGQVTASVCCALGQCLRERSLSGREREPCLGSSYIKKFTLTSLTKNMDYILVKFVCFIKSNWDSFLGHD